MKRNLLKCKTEYLNELIGKVWIKKNTGAYGAISLPSKEECLNIRSDSTFKPEKNDIQSQARSNSHSRLKSIRGRGIGAVSLSLDFDMTGDVTKEPVSSVLWELALGKKTYNATQVGAKKNITDLTSAKAGVIITCSGNLLGFSGNYVTLKVVNGGSTGTESLTSSGSNYVLTVYEDNTVEEIVSLINSDANLSCVVDANGNDETDLFVDLLANAGIVSGKTVYFAGGADAGYQYDDSECPYYDANLVVGKDKSGYAVTGVFFDKYSVEITDGIPSQKFEGQSKYSYLQGMTTLTANVSSANKLYLDDYKVFGEVDSNCPQFVDIVAVDGITHKYTALRITGSGSDLTGAFITVESNINAQTGDFVAWHEPVDYTPVINPLNGLAGVLKIDGEAYPEFRNLKIEGSNNLEVLEFALQNSLSGFTDSKYHEIKITATLNLRKDKMGLLNKLTAGETVTIPVEVVIGNVAGKKVSIFARFVEFKAPSIATKADSATELPLEGTIVFNEDAPNVPSFVICFN